jgi:hypothetical protein
VPINGIRSQTLYKVDVRRIRRLGTTEDIAATIISESDSEEEVWATVTEATTGYSDGEGR